MRALALVLVLGGLAHAQTSRPVAPPTSQPAPPSDLERQFAAALAADQPAMRPAPAPTGSRGFQSLNPDISVIADLAGGYFQRRPASLSGDDPAGTGLHLQELELAFSAIVDPYFRGDVYLAIPNLAGLEVEEAAVTTLSLPLNLQLRAGMLRATIGRQNPQHLHVQDFTRRPGLNALLLGADGFRAPGGELSVLLPLPVYAAVYGGAFAVRGPETITPDAPRPTFGGGDPEDFTYLGTLKLFFALSERTSLYTGGSFVAGKAPQAVSLLPGAAPFQPVTRSYLYGGDLYLKWQPPNTAAGYFALAWQTEYFARTIADRPAEGALYSQLVMRLARRFSVGVRAEVLGLPRGDLFPARGFVGAGSLTFTPTEFSRLRLSGEGHYHDLVPGGGVKTFGVALVQLEVSLGAHGAHAF